VAFEMAHQLTAAGESVRLLAIIDAVLLHLQPTIGSRLKRLATKSPREIVAAVKRRASRAAERLAGRGAAGTGIEVPDWYGVPPAFHDIATRHYRAVSGYVPRPYHGDVWLFRSKDARFSPDMGWATVVKGKLDIAMIPGGHSNVLKEPNLAEMARQLSAVLDALAASGE
jgi:thioesterase domain-containing protein